MTLLVRVPKNAIMKGPAPANIKLAADIPWALLLDNMVNSSDRCVILPAMAPVAAYPTFHRRWLARKPKMIIPAAMNSPPILEN